MRKLLQWIMDRRPTKVYRVDGEDLFYRGYLFKVCGWVFYLHHYLRSDPDRGLHNHPFKAIALVLSGGYVEERIVGYNENGFVLAERVLNPGSINRIDQHVFHRLRIDHKLIADTKIPGVCGIHSVQPTSWSLFICKYIPNQSWGFMKAYDSINPDIAHTFLFTKAGQTELEHDWFITASKGRYVCKTQ